MELENVFARQKLKADIYTYPPKQQSPQGSYDRLPGRGKLLIHPWQQFFKNQFPPSSKGEEETVDPMLIYKNMQT